MNGHLAKTNTLSHYLNNECVNFLASLTSAKGLACYEVDHDANPVKLRLHGLDSSLIAELAFSKDSPLHPGKSTHHDKQILSLKAQASSELSVVQDSCSQQLKTMGFSEVIDFKFRRDGVVIAGISLFFQDNKHFSENIESNDLVAIYDFIESTINKLNIDDQDKVMDRFCQQKGLTKKEKQVLKLSLRGMTNQAISDELYCSIATVKTHLQHIFSKLEINSKAEAVNLFINSNC